MNAIDYTAMFARDVAMGRWYEAVLGFHVARELSPQWIE
jgi:hypothetical protein